MNRRTFALWPLYSLICIFLSCQPPHSSQMLGGLQGGSSPDEVRARLQIHPLSSGWSEKQELNPNDPRPKHDFLSIKGPYSDLGISGQLELTFYNDRLMDAQFTPNQAERYFEQISKRLGSLGGKPGRPKNISREVSIEYHRGPGDSVWFTWTYLPVSREWEDWVAKYSQLFHSRQFYGA